MLNATQNHDALWCNGSTVASEAICPGSNPGGVTIMFTSSCIHDIIIQICGRGTAQSTTAGG